MVRLAIPTSCRDELGWKPAEFDVPEMHGQREVRIPKVLVAREAVHHGLYDGEEIIDCLLPALGADLGIRS